MNKYRALILDYGGVYSFDYDKATPRRIARQLFNAERPEATPPRLGDLEGQLACGLITTQQYIDEYAEILHASTRPSPDVLEKAIVDASREPSPPMMRLVSTVRERGIYTVLLSDVCAFEVQIGDSRRRYDGFDLALLSARESLSKKSPEFFELILKRLPIRPDECLFFDDSEYCVETARSLGIDSILAGKDKFADADSLASFIESRL